MNWQESQTFKLNVHFFFAVLSFNHLQSQTFFLDVITQKISIFPGGPFGWTRRRGVGKMMFVDFFLRLAELDMGIVRMILLSLLHIYILDVLSQCSILQQHFVE